METARKTALTPRQTEARRQQLLAAERSGIMEGLPPASDFARQMGERYALGEITADQAVARIIEHYKGR